jgi:truncated hemoglobin YjbI
MEAETFFFAMFLGAIVGSIGTISIQAYGRRKVKAAMKQGGLTPTRETELLANENQALKGQMLRLEDRLSVMERITTDSHIGLSHEIERLR